MNKVELSEKTNKLLAKLNKVSEANMMHQLLDHPWDVPRVNCWLKKRENLSIYGTSFYELATEDELMRLSMQETGAWWNTFIIFENLVSEYYLKIINHESLQQYPEVVRYMHHFCKEEVNHSMVFRKAMEHFNIEPFPVPDNLKDFYKDNASLADFPLKAIYLTIVIEWFAENNALLDLKNDFVSPLARAIAVEHHKEEARHIEWGKSMIREFYEHVPGFMEEAQEYTAPFMRGLLDMSTTNPITYERVAFKDPAFQDQERLFEEAIFCDNRKKINQDVMAPLMRFFVEVGIYKPELHDIWVAARFEEDVELAIAKTGKKLNDDLLNQEDKLLEKALTEIN